jgi:hypothetical protein
MKTNIMAVVLLLAACGNPVAHIPEFRQAAVTTPQLIPAVRGGAYYRLVPYDQINIRFPYHPEQDSTILTARSTVLRNRRTDTAGW